MADKFDLDDHVTKSIIAAMEAGTPPWRKPWTGDSAGAAFPLRANGEPYRGINVLMLWLEAGAKGYASAHWFTYKQAQEIGGQVRKGEKSATVVKYGTVEKEGEDGEERRFAYARAYRVFNADQIEGLPEEYYRSPAQPARDLGTRSDPALEDYFAATGARMVTSDRPQAFYNITEDLIHMPPIATFHDAGAYYATLAHEATHWTGHRTRLDRFANGRDRKAYAYEELVAEIGACMLCATLGLVPDFEQSGAYVKGWLEALANDNRLIFRAASDAQKAIDFIAAAAEAGQAVLAA